MEVRLAETFLKVAEVGNVTRAAEYLGYSQAAVTAQIKQLEDELGVKLFDRIGRGIQLTELGRQFIPLASNLVRANMEAASFGSGSAEPSGRISIIAGSSLTYEMLPRIIITFKHQYPLVKIGVQAMDDKRTMLSALNHNMCDFVFDLELQEGGHDGCVVAFEHREKFIFAGHVTDPLTTKKDVTLQEVVSDSRNYPFIFHEGNAKLEWRHSGISMEEILAESGIEIEREIYMGSSIAIVKVLLEGNSRALVPWFAVEEEIEAGNLAEIHVRDFERKAYVQLYYNEHKWVSPAMKAFIDYINKKGLPKRGRVPAKRI